MELKIKTPTIPEVIEFNFDELKTEIEAKANEYATLVYTEDLIKDAKADRATLRKFVDALETERKKVKAECLQPYEEFEKKIKELTGIINKPIGIIDAQVKQFEDAKKAKKLEEIQDYWQECEDLGQVPESITLMMVFDEKWMNASVSMKSVKDAIDERINKIKADINTLDNLPEFGFEAKQEYMRSLDLGKAIAEGQRLADIQKRKAEAEAQKKAAEQESATQQIRKDADPVPQENRTWITFKANLTIGEAYELRDFFKSRNIEFKSV